MSIELAASTRILIIGNGNLKNFTYNIKTTFWSHFCVSFEGVHHNGIKYFDFTSMYSGDDDDSEFNSENYNAEKQMWT